MHPERADTRDKPVLSTMHAAEDPYWDARVEVLARRASYLRDLVAFWRSSKNRKAIILRGSVSFAEGYRDLVFAIIVRFRRRRPRVLITDATWEVGSAALSRRFPWLTPVIPHVARLLVRMVDGAHVHYGVLSTAELITFPNTWRVNGSRVAFTGFPHTLFEGAEDREVADGGYLFAGGNSLRDYDLLERAVSSLEVPLVVAGNWQPSDPNLAIRAAPVTHDRFVELLANCRACVVPIRESVRSAGQQTYLNAMVLGKPVIVTDAPGVRDFVEHGVTGFIVPPDPEALAAAIDQIMDPSHVAKNMAMGRRARQAVLERHTEHTYRRRLLELCGIE